MPQVAARQTSSNAPAVAGAMIWAYEKLLGRKPASKTSWLYPLALSALETASWKAMWNYNAGNVTTSAAHEWFYNPHVTGDLKFANFPTLGAGCLAEMHWLSAHGGLVAADAGDYDGFMGVLEKGCYAGCVPYPSLQGNITQLQNVTPKRYWELSSAATLAIAIGILGVGVGGAYLLDPELFSLPAAPKKRLHAAENPSMEIQSLLFSRGKWQEADAKEWAREHGYKAGKAEVSPKYIRIRQLPPDRFSVLRTKTLSADEGIKAIVGR